MSQFNQYVGTLTVDNVNKVANFVTKDGTPILQVLDFILDKPPVVILQNRNHDKELMIRELLPQYQTLEKVLDACYRVNMTKQEILFVATFFIDAQNLAYASRVSGILNRYPEWKVTF